MVPFGKCSSFFAADDIYAALFHTGHAEEDSLCFFCYYCFDFDRVSHVLGVYLDLSHYGHVSLSIAQCGGSYVCWLHGQSEAVHEVCVHDAFCCAAGITCQFIFF